MKKWLIAIMIVAGCFAMIVLFSYLVFTVLFYLEVDKHPNRALALLVIAMMTPFVYLIHECLE
jgi:Kef-type K+ transport system membrane component KefB